MYAVIAIRRTYFAKHVQNNPAVTRIPMVAHRIRHHHHHQGHGPQHLTIAQEAPGARLGALPQDDLRTQDGMIPQTQLGVVPTQVGANDIALPQTIASACCQLAPQSVLQLLRMPKGLPDFGNHVFRL